jgi:hypothetical protein
VAAALLGIEHFDVIASIRLEVERFGLREVTHQEAGTSLLSE